MLDVQNLHLSMANTEILRGVSLKAARDEIVAVVGRNGAGKSSTFKSIIGIYKPTKGKIIFDGLDLTTLPPHKRVKAGVGYVPEDMRIFPYLTAKENIELAAFLSKNINKLDEIMELVYTVFPEVKSFLDRLGYYLSGGEKKMLAIARSLATLPKTVLVDEALEGLAPIVVDRFVKAIASIKEHGIGVVIAESNVLLATKAAERIYVIERGEIIFEGNASDLMNNVQVMKILRGA
ncbi:MAG: ABC transporter ATP-binding protein [Candidatus Caldarchaeum sp.]|nr:ABC transporter ATP-binding protein [Candidatus Caldarchaeum sp.]MCX8201630.1 ABC transporter ATP-binding protein [Candidatus Caldarchaeum sp.]MDW8435088.1 ABC transporter ATP-binding protein [Candidatus Caldarchaeum sp.]